MAQTHERGRRLAQAALYVALAAAILGAIALPAMAAESRTLLTITDGPVQVLRGAQKFEAAEGLTLADDDIVRTTAATRVARIEFADGRALDLGPATQVLLLSERAAQAQGWAGASAVVAQGWVKLSAGAAVSSLVTPHGIVMGDARGAMLTHTAADGSALAFAESRGLTLRPRGAGAEVLLREGETWSRDGASGMVRVAARHTALRDVPRALADTLPRRATRFDGGAGEPADGQPVDTADLAAWSQAEPALMALMTQWRGARSGGNSTITRPSRAVKTAGHAPRRSSPARAVARAPASGIVVQGLPVPAAAADFGDAQPFTLPATALLTTEPVLSTRVSTPQRR
jgi:hypothetical protein